MMYGYICKYVQESLFQPSDTMVVVTHCVSLLKNNKMSEVNSNWTFRPYGANGYGNPFQLRQGTISQSRKLTLREKKY